jgi:hypothetical protein
MALSSVSDVKAKNLCQFEIVVYLMSSCVNWAFFCTRVLKWPTCAKKGPIYTRTS